MKILLLLLFLPYLILSFLAFIAFVLCNILTLPFAIGQKNIKKRLIKGFGDKWNELFG